MAKKLGLTYNRYSGVGRVAGNPVINNGWATLRLRTMVGVKQADGSWQDTEAVVPVMTNNPRTIETIQQYVQDERQLLIEGYVTSWENGAGVMITSLKLGSKTMFDPDAQQGGNQQQGSWQPQGGQTNSVPAF